MPPTIDPVSNLLDTFLGVFGRAALFYLAGIIGVTIGELSAAFQLDYLTDLPYLFETLVSSVNFSALIYCVSWPITIGIVCLLEMPLYALFLMVVVVTCFTNVVVRDEPSMFWALILSLFIALVPLLSNRSLDSMIPFSFFIIVIAVAMYYVIHRDYPEWIDKIRDLNSEKDSEE